MISTKCSKLVSVLIFCVFYCVSSVDSQDVNITIPLNGIITFDNRELYSDFETINASSLLKINFNNVNKSIAFITLQVHAHLKNITLYQNVIKNMAVTGNNVGTVVFPPMLDTYFVDNSNNQSVRVYIAVHGYTETDPIPGGCNLVYPPISPTVHITTNNNYINMDAGNAANGSDPSCLIAHSAYVTFYMMYLPEMSFDADDYFEGLKTMMSYKNILKYGQTIPQTLSTRPLRRALSTYPGAGRIFVAVARPLFNLDAGYSVYVPSYSYGCTVVEGGCDDTDDMVSHILCAILLFVGIFVCFFGHRFFKTEMFLAGFFSCVIVTYICMSLITTSTTTVLIGASTISGIFFGSIWLLFWWLYGIPVIAVLLPSLNLGFLLAALFYYRLPANIMYLENDLNFWPLFVLVMFMTALTLVSVTFAANILCCAILGSYATVYSMDYFLGSNLKYIVINVIRRAVVDEFHYAVLLPPFQWREFLMTFVWMVLAALGFSLQHWYNKGRPPFPPPPRNTRPTMPEPYMYGAVVDYPGWNRPQSSVEPRPQSINERAPLLANQY